MSGPLRGDFFTHTACPSVCLSVRHVMVKFQRKPTHAWCGFQQNGSQNILLYCGNSKGITTKAQIFVVGLFRISRNWNRPNLWHFS